MSKILFIDTETSGLLPNEHGLIQVGGIIEIDGKVVEKFDLKMNLFEDDKIDQDALDVNGFTEEQIKEFYPSEEIYHEFIAILSKYVGKFDKTDKYIWVGQNINFDIGFITAWAKKCDDKYLGSFIDWSKIFCTRYFATGLNSLGLIPNSDKMKSASLAGQCEFFGITNEKAHDALADTTATRELYHKLVDIATSKITS